jgi:hypothetical protein
MAVGIQMMWVAFVTSYALPVIDQSLPQVIFEIPKPNSLNRITRAYKTRYLAVCLSGTIACSHDGG